MALTDFRICNYRSVKDIWLKLNPVNVFVGPNGCGKSNLYRALYLMSTTASGQFARSIGEEGGMDSALWCGPYSKQNDVAMTFSVRIDDLRYDLVCGHVQGDFATGYSEEGRILLPGQGKTVFRNDVEIKSEKLYRLKGGSKSALLNRRFAEVTARDAITSKSSDYTLRIAPNESFLTGVRDPLKFPELSSIRMELLNWRFYHHFRTDKSSPLRRPQIPVRTSIMAHDGSDFVAALETILEKGAGDKLLSALNDAFPKSDLDISLSNAGLRLRMTMPGLHRPLEAFELSDGTLQYLCLLAAIYSQSPPSLLAINEPETSIHPNLFEPLARMLASASESTQIWLTTHSTELANYMEEYCGYPPQELEKVDGETRLVGVGLGGYRDEEEYEDQRRERMAKRAAALDDDDDDDDD
jgi:predicted ATPase